MNDETQTATEVGRETTTPTARLTEDEASALLDAISFWRGASQDGDPGYDDTGGSRARELRQSMRSAERKLAIAAKWGKG
jgi:hypothetical protein